ncbi:MAG: hypothetical protein A3F67_11695 [Verrucomicrobia bacterium RIFCSPHIGHO2_12_FULL_41_10]|nr:MAG: hypothetical protein A3F67_11695 [Verrucomicrobia bacterium RIFCSPHIGHO2_12_FULL_41_10]
MRETIVHYIDKLGSALGLFVYLTMFIYGLFLLDREKFPFRWRRVWAVLFLDVAWNFFLPHIIHGESMQRDTVGFYFFLFHTIHGESMQRDTADFLNSLEPIVNVLINTIILIIGLSLWDKEKFPFRWRRVWGVFFLYLACSPFLFRAVQLIKTS